MATATTAPPVPVEPDVVLTLTVDEAATLRAVCGSIAGAPRLSRRGHTDSVFAALGEVPEVMGRYCIAQSHMGGQIDFTNEEGLA